MWDSGKLVAMSIFTLELLTWVKLEIKNNHVDTKGLRAQGCHENGYKGRKEHAPFNLLSFH